jgi:hypothetical protein
MVGLSTFRSDDACAAYCQLSESDIETSFEHTHLFNAGGPSKPPFVGRSANCAPEPVPRSVRVAD